MRAVLMVRIGAKWRAGPMKMGNIASQLRYDAALNVSILSPAARPYSW
jgi:hypothetical protein